MLIRIVRMTFKEEHREEFLAIFKSNQARIEAMPGCFKVELMQDWDDPKVFITYSTWKDQQALEAYRNSELFRGVWKQTKALFAQRAQAFSMKPMNV